MEGIICNKSFKLSTLDPKSNLSVTGGCSYTAFPQEILGNIIYSDGGFLSPKLLPDFHIQREPSN